MFSCSRIKRNIMSLALTLLFLGQVYCGTLANVGTHISTRIAFPSIDQSLARNGIRRSDYRYTHNIGSHKLHTTAVTWVKALKICQDEGGHLAVINSRAEADVIADIFTAAGPHRNSQNRNYAWIGTHDLFSHQGDYETIFGDSLARAGFDVWYEARSYGNPFCGTVYRNGELSWFTCTRKLGFVCELPYRVDNEGAYGITQEATWWLRQALKKKLSPTLVLWPSQNTTTY